MSGEEILGGNSLDRVIGMLLERLESVRELHDNIRQEADEQRKDVASVQSLIARLISQLESHEKTDSAAFSAISRSHSELSIKLDALTAAINSATTAGLIQKAQLAAGWKVIAVIGGLAMAAVAIFAIFFNHKWN